jgi:membrane-bound serine protease (ClpP class)
VRFLTSAIVASLLLSLGFLLILGDVLVEGFGIVGVIGLALIGLFFWGHFLVGLAGWEGVALVALGLALIALELFVIPGFGVAGVLGVIALLGGLFISLYDSRIVTSADLTRAGVTVLATLGLIVVGIVVLLRALPRIGAFQGLVLQDQVGAATIPLARRPRSRFERWIEGERLEAEHAANRSEGRVDVPRLTGAIGIARSDLRPGGIAEIDGQRVDVVSRGEYIPAGVAVEVVADEGYRRVVRRVDAPSQAGR